MTVTVEIKTHEATRTRMGMRPMFAIRSVGPRLGGDDFGFYMGTIKSIARQTPAGTRFSGYPLAAWITDADAVAGIVAAFQARGWTVALDEHGKDAVVGGVANAEAHNAEIQREAADREATAKMAIERANEALSKRGFSLYAFQREGIAHLCAIPAGKSALLADEMGLGKTLQTISALATRAVVVCPAVAKGVWAREIAAYRPDLRVTVISGRNNFRWPAEGEVIVINYDVLPACPKGKDDRGFDLLYSTCSAGEAPDGCDLVADEAHMLKSNKTARTLNFRSLRAAVGRAKGRTILLTATPILNRPPELWSLLTSASLARPAFGSYEAFKSLFGGRDNGYGTDWLGPTAEGSREIGERLSRVMLRRLRANVLDLPRKTWQPISVELSAATAKVCDKFLAELTKTGRTIEDLLDGKVAATFEKLSMIRATLASAKIEALEEEIESYEDAGEPVVVFSAHRLPIDRFATREGWRVITGDTSPEERTQIQDAFQAGTLRGVACTIKAGGVAITLTRASHAIFCDLEWTPALNAQAEDRILRIGQTRPVVIKRLICAHPLDERIAQLLGKKQTIIDASIEQTSGVASAQTVPFVTIPLVDLSKAIDTLEVEKIEREARDAEARDDKARKHTSKRAMYAGTGDARSASSAREVWADYAIRSLMASCDGVKTKDDVGFSASTRHAGAWLAVELESTNALSEEGWKLAVAIASYHQRQVGLMPKEG